MFVAKLKSATAVLVATAMALSAAGGVYKVIAEEPSQVETQPAQASATARRFVTPPADVPPAKTPAEAKPSEPSVPGLPYASEQLGHNVLPLTPLPRRVLVALAKGQVLVRTREVIYEPITMRTPDNPNRTVTVYQQVELLKTRPYPIVMVKVYDTNGKRIDAKQLPKLLKKEIVALFSSDERAADPNNLRLFKEGTLLFVVPEAPPPAAPVYATPAQPVPIGPVPPPRDEYPVPPPPTPSPLPPAPAPRLVPVAPVPSSSPASPAPRGLPHP